MKRRKINYKLALFITILFCSVIVSNFIFENNSNKITGAITINEIADQLSNDYYKTILKTAASEEWEQPYTSGGVSYKAVYQIKKINSEYQCQINSYKEGKLLYICNYGAFWCGRDEFTGQKFSKGSKQYERLERYTDGMGYPLCESVYEDPIYDSTRDLEAEKPITDTTTQTTKEENSNNKGQLETKMSNFKLRFKLDEIAANQANLFLEIYDTLGGQLEAERLRIDKGESDDFLIDASNSEIYIEVLSTTGEGTGEFEEISAELLVKIVDRDSKDVLSSKILKIKFGPFVTNTETQDTSNSQNTNSGEILDETSQIKIYDACIEDNSELCWDPDFSGCPCEKTENTKDDQVENQEQKTVAKATSSQESTVELSDKTTLSDYFSITTGKTDKSVIVFLDGFKPITEIYADSVTLLSDGEYEFEFEYNEKSYKCIVNTKTLKDNCNVPAQAPMKVAEKQTDTVEPAKADEIKEEPIQTQEPKPVETPKIETVQQTTEPIAEQKTVQPTAKVESVQPVEIKPVSKQIRGAESGFQLETLSGEELQIGVKEVTDDKVVFVVNDREYTRSQGQAFEYKDFKIVPQIENGELSVNVETAGEFEVKSLQSSAAANSNSASTTSTKTESGSNNFLYLIGAVAVGLYIKNKSKKQEA